MPDPIDEQTPAAEKTTESRPVAPVKVAVIGTGDGSRLQPGTELETPGEHQPNVVITAVVQPAVALLIRSGNLLFKSMFGLVTAAMTPEGGEMLYRGDFADLLVTCFKLSVPIVVVGGMKDFVTVFGKLEEKFPLLTGKV